MVAIFNNKHSKMVIFHNQSQATITEFFIGKSNYASTTSQQPFNMKFL
jgi:hypothetical protein